VTLRLLRNGTSPNLLSTRPSVFGRIVLLLVCHPHVALVADKHLEVRLTPLDVCSFADSPLGRLENLSILS
jgi:hypothetical protein